MSLPGKRKEMAYMSPISYLNRIKMAALLHSQWFLIRFKWGGLILTCFCVCV